MTTRSRQTSASIQHPDYSHSPLKVARKRQQEQEQKEPEAGQSDTESEDELLLSPKKTHPLEPNFKRQKLEHVRHFSAPNSTVATAEAPSIPSHPTGSSSSLLSRSQSVPTDNSPRKVPHRDLSLTPTRRKFTPPLVIHTHLPSISEQPKFDVSPTSPYRPEEPVAEPPASSSVGQPSPDAMQDYAPRTPLQSNRACTPPSPLTPVSDSSDIPDLGLVPNHESERKTSPTPQRRQLRSKALIVKQPSRLPRPTTDKPVPPKANKTASSSSNSKTVASSSNKPQDAFKVLMGASQSKSQAKGKGKLKAEPSAKTIEKQRSSSKTVQSKPPAPALEGRKPKMLNKMKKKGEKSAPRAFVPPPPRYHDDPPPPTSDHEDERAASDLIPLPKENKTDLVETLNPSPNGRIPNASGSLADIVEGLSAAGNDASNMTVQELVETITNGETIPIAEDAPVLGVQEETAVLPVDATADPLCQLASIPTLDAPTDTQDDPMEETTNHLRLDSPTNAQDDPMDETLSSPILDLTSIPPEVSPEEPTVPRTLPDTSEPAIQDDLMSESTPSLAVESVLYSSAPAMQADSVTKPTPSELPESAPEPAIHDDPMQEIADAPSLEHPPNVSETISQDDPLGDPTPADGVDSATPPVNLLVERPAQGSVVGAKPPQRAIKKRQMLPPPAPRVTRSTSQRQNAAAEGPSDTKSGPVAKPVAAASKRTSSIPKPKGTAKATNAKATGPSKVSAADFVRPTPQKESNSAPSSPTKLSRSSSMFVKPTTDFYPRPDLLKSASALSTLTDALERLNAPPPMRPSTSMGINREFGGPGSDDSDDAPDRLNESMDDSILTAFSDRKGLKRTATVADLAAPGKRPPAGSTKPTAGRLTQTRFGAPKASSKLTQTKLVFGGTRRPMGLGTGRGLRANPKASKNPSLPSVLASPQKGQGANDGMDDDVVDEPSSFLPPDTDKDDDVFMSPPSDDSPTIDPLDKGKGKEGAYKFRSSANGHMSPPASRNGVDSFNHNGHAPTDGAIDLTGSPALPSGPADTSLPSAESSAQAESSFSLRHALPSMSGTSDVLKKCNVFVDVRTDIRIDAGELFVKMLKDMGAHVAARVGQRCTHIVYKDGLPSTITRYLQLSEPRPLVVGIGWVVKCVEEKARVDESKYIVDLEEVDTAGHKRRKSMLPKAMFLPEAPEYDFAPSGDPDPNESVDGSSTSMCLDDDLPPLERARRRKSMLPPQPL